MATVLRKTDPLASDLVTAVNNLKAFCMAELRAVRADLVSIASDSVAFATPALADPGAHNDVSERVNTTADPDDGAEDDGLADAIALTNELIGLYNFHLSDTLAHKTTGVALASSVFAVDLTTAMARANDIKSKYETHRASTTYHYTADSTNTISATNATTLAELITLLIELRDDINAHMASGPSAKSIRLVDA